MRISSMQAVYVLREAMASDGQRRTKLGNMPMKKGGSCPAEVYALAILMTIEDLTDSGIFRDYIHDATGRLLDEQGLLANDDLLELLALDVEERRTGEREGGDDADPFDEPEPLDLHEARIVTVLQQLFRAKGDRQAMPKAGLIRTAELDVSNEFTIQPLGDSYPPWGRPKKIPDLKDAHLCGGYIVMMGESLPTAIYIVSDVGNDPAAPATVKVAADQALEGHGG